MDIQTLWEIILGLGIVLLILVGLALVACIKYYSSKKSFLNSFIRFKQV